MSTPCLPAPAICRARLATSCPATSRKSRLRAALSGTSGESKGKSAAARIPPRNRRPYWASPSTLTVSPSSAHTSEQPLFLAHNAKASEPATPRTKPSSESSPTNRRFSMQARSICPVAAKSATAMGRSETRASLSQGAWREVDDDFVARHLKPARPKGGPHALTRLLDRSVAHAHDREARKPV